MKVDKPRGKEVVGIDGKDEFGDIGMPLSDRQRVAGRRSDKGRAAARVIGQLPAKEGRVVDVASNDGLEIILEEPADSLINVEFVMCLRLGEFANVSIHAT